jgi:hypothetical protein
MFISYFSHFSSNEAKMNGQYLFGPEWMVPKNLPTSFVRNIPEGLETEIYAYWGRDGSKEGDHCHWYELFDKNGKYLGQHTPLMFCEDLSGQLWYSGEICEDKFTRFRFGTWNPPQETYHIKENGLIWMVHEYVPPHPLTKIWKGTYDAAHQEELLNIFKASLEKIEEVD